MPASIYSLAPIRLTVSGGASQTIPCENHGFSPEILQTANAHSGNIAPTLIASSGANPRVVASIPFYQAYLTFGLGVAKLTALEVFLSTYADFVRSSGADHYKVALSAGAFAAAQIVDWNVNVDGVLMAQVEFVLLSDDQVHPFALTGGNSLPSLTGSPVLHTLGPAKINNAVIPGSTAHSGSVNGQLITTRSDGDLFPRVAARPMVAPTMRIAHADPVAVLSSLGLLGAYIAATTELYFKQYDATTGVTRSDGGAIKIAVAAGRILPDGWQADQGQVATGGFVVHGITTDGGTHPFVITLNVVPPVTP